MEEIKVNAIVLQAFQSKDSDLVLFLLSKERGKIKVYAKGAKKSKRRFFGGLDIFTKADFLLSHKENSEFHTVHSVENKNILVSIASSLPHFVILSLLCELTMSAFSDHDRDSGELFDLLNTLRNTCEKKETLEKTIPLATFYLLKVSLLMGVDATEINNVFREDDQAWFKAMVSTNRPIHYSPNSSLFRAFYGLATYLSREANTEIISLKSLKELGSSWLDHQN